MIKIVRAKLHGITVTGAELDYHGSITLDPEQCELAGILPLEFVEIWNKASGARITTYVIYGKPGSRCCVLNGAAARTCQKGDQVIICASAQIAQASDLYGIRPAVLTFGPENRVDEVMHYEVKQTEARRYDFSVRSERGSAAPTRQLGAVDIAALSQDLKTMGLGDLAVADLLSKHLSQYS
jgi:aspartate 1-decarboxylase